MTEGVNTQEIAKPEEKSAPREGISDKEYNFRRLEAEREKDREARIRAEVQAQQMQAELERIKQSLKPVEKDILDEMQDITDLDPAKFKTLLSQRDAKLKREAEQIAARAIEEHEQKKKKTNFRDELRRQYQDYDSIMNEQTITHFMESEPEAVEAINAIEDDYARCEKAYKFFKKRIPQSQKVNEVEKEKVPAIQDIVQENQMNPYMIPASMSTPPSSYAVDFDTRSPAKRKEAYEKLKNAQRRPIGNGPALAPQH